MIIWLILAPCLLLIGVCIYPPSRRAIQERIFPAYSREILATADGDLLGDGNPVKVIKYKGPDTIFLEVIDPVTNVLVARILLPDRHDGMFNLHGRVTKLAIADIDSDGRKELLAPTFDDQLVPHLNIYRYNPGSKRFESVKAP
jgi:hypothetical protein